MKALKTIFISAALLSSFEFIQSELEAKVIQAVVEYKDGNATLEGFVAYDDSLKSQSRPGVIIVHEWTGLGPYVKDRALEMAKLGYTAFAADIYGKGIRPQGAEAAGAEAGKYKSNRPLLRSRALAAVEKLKSMNIANNSKLVAMGYCFGGTSVLELARSGNTDIKAVVSFHGGLSTPLPAAAPLKTKILILHGADDPYVPKEEVLTFQAEMQNAKADWQFISYGNAVHSFTNKEAGTDNSKGAAYNQLADKRSFIAMKSFFDEVLR